VGRCKKRTGPSYLAAGTGLAELLQLTGIVEVESLLYYSRGVEGARTQRRPCDRHWRELVSAGRRIRRSPRC
jgi:hypothetical protein